MKNLMIFAMLFLMTLTASFKALATGDNENSKSRLAVINGSNGKYNLYYASENEENVRVNLYDAKSNLLHTEYIRNYNGFKLPYDLSNLSEGVYEIKLITTKENFSTKIYHTKESGYFKAFIKPEGEKYKVKVVRQTMHPVMISILDKNHHVLYSEKIDVDYNFEKVYDLKKTRNAKYISVVSQDKTIDYIIK